MAMRMDLADHSLTQNPRTIIQDVRERATGTNDDMYCRLEIQAQNATFTAGIKVETYMKTHKALRLQVFQEEYPNIK